MQILSNEAAARLSWMNCRAHLGLSDWLAEHGDFVNAIKALDEVISKPGCRPEELSHALVNRGVAKGQLGDAQGATADCTAVIQLEGAPKEQVAMAFLCRGVAKRQLGDAHGEMADYTAVLQLEGAPKKQVVWALFNRGVIQHQLGEAQGAIADYTAAIQLEGAPKEEIARALVNRGVAKGQLGDVQGAMADYTAVIQLEGVPKEQVAKALILRAASCLPAGLTSEVFSDLLKVIRSGVTEDNLMSDAAAFAIAGGLDGDIKMRTEEVLRELSLVLGSLSSVQAREVTLRFLNALATPETKEVWPNVWRGLVVRLKPEVAEAVGFFEPVCRVLEGEDRSLLDALPPEQREFALEVLTKFESRPVAGAKKAERAKPKDTRS